MNINAFKIATALVVCTGLSGCVSLKETVPMELYPESSHYVNPDKQDSYFGSGYQQFVCTQDTEGYYWKFVKSQATLYPSTLIDHLFGLSQAPDNSIGSLFASTTQEFKRQDGSQVVGTEIVKHVPSADPKKDIPQLRLRARSSAKGNKAFDSVKAILRVDTHGGMPTRECSEASLGSYLNSRFSATYVMWK